LIVLDDRSTLVVGQAYDFNQDHRNFSSGFSVFKDDSKIDKIPAATEGTIPVW